jgi:hypothetical protein
VVVRLTTLESSFNHCLPNLQLRGNALILLASIPQNCPATARIPRRSASGNPKRPKLRIVAYTLVDNLPIRSRQLSVLDSLPPETDDRRVATNLCVHGQDLRETIAEFTVCDCHDALESFPMLYCIESGQCSFELACAL